MSTEETPQSPQDENQSASPDTVQEQTNQPVAKPPALGKKPRNPIERAVVWILILAIVGFGLFECRALYGHKRSLENLTSEFQKIQQLMLEKHDKGLLMTEDQLNGFIEFFPSRDVEVNDEKKVKIITLKWPSLLKEYEFKVGVDISNAENPIALIVRDRDDVEIKPSQFVNNIVMKKKYYDLLVETKGNLTGNKNLKGKKRRKRNKKNKAGSKTQTVGSP